MDVWFAKPGFQVSGEIRPTVILVGPRQWRRGSLRKSRGHRRGFGRLLSGMPPDSEKKPEIMTWPYWAKKLQLFQRPLYLTVFLLVLVGFLAVTWYGFRKAGQAGTPSGRRILYYVDPMNPAHTSPEPGLAPCGMNMEPVYADEGQEAGPAGLPPGAVKVTPQKQQLIGVRAGVVEKTPYTHTLRALGRVAVDETRIYRLNSFVDGWILKTFDNTTGSLIMKDEPLASYYTRELISAQQSYLYSLSTLDRLDRGDQPSKSQIIATNSQIRTAEENLQNLGMSNSQIKELAQTRRLKREIYLQAPITSFVLTRNVSPGQVISKNDELYKLGDLSRVWIVADLYENEAPFIKPGLKAKAALPSGRKTLEATVTDVLPEFDKVSTTLRVRLEADNPEYVLRPNMFVDLEFLVNLPDTIHVPVDAVLDTGLKKIVFVDRGEGYFEPRKVETGWRFGDQVEITEGLKPGEHIVISGNFLLDSESRMKLAAAGMYGEVARDPVCGLQLDENKAKNAGHQSQFNNQTYSFCSEECKETFNRNPERYAGEKGQKAAGDQASAMKPGNPAKAQDPVCGLEVDEAQAKMRGLTSEYQGKTYYFSEYQCNKQFDQDPGRYVPQLSESSPHELKKQEEAGVVRDPVSGQDVDQTQAATRYLKRVYNGTAYYFADAANARKFEQDPGRYISKTAAAPEAMPSPGNPETTSTIPECSQHQTAAMNAGNPPDQTRPGLEEGSYLGKALGDVKLPEAVKGTPYIDKDPVCGMKLGPQAVKDLAYKTPYKGKIYYFCSDQCKEAFDRNPENYVRKLEAELAAQPAPEPAATGPAPTPAASLAMDKPADNVANPGKAGPSTLLKCQVCASELQQGGNNPAYFKSSYKGKTYNFCSRECQEKFGMDPERYLKESQESAAVPDTYKRKLLQPMYQKPPRRVPRGPTEKMRQKALEAMGQEVVQEASPGAPPVAPPSPQVKQQEPQAPKIPADPQQSPKPEATPAPNLSSKAPPKGIPPNTPQHEVCPKPGSSQ